MKKEIIIAGSLGLVAGLVIMHFAMKMKKNEAKSGANGDFVTDKSKKVWDNMLDMTGTHKGGQVKGRVSNMLDADASEVSNMLDVQGTKAKHRYDYADGEDQSNMLDANGQSRRYFPRANARVQAIVNNARGNRSWPNPKTGSGWS